MTSEARLEMTGGSGSAWLLGSDMCSGSGCHSSHRSSISCSTHPAAYHKRPWKCMLHACSLFMSQHEGVYSCIFMSAKPEKMAAAEKSFEGSWRVGCHRQIRSPQAHYSVHAQLKQPCRHQLALLHFHDTQPAW